MYSNPSTDHSVNVEDSLAWSATSSDRAPTRRAAPAVAVEKSSDDSSSFVRLDAEHSSSDAAIQFLTKKVSGGSGKRAPRKSPSQGEGESPPIKRATSGSREKHTHLASPMFAATVSNRPMTPRSGSSPSYEPLAQQLPIGEVSAPIHKICSGESTPRDETPQRYGPARQSVYRKEKRRPSPVSLPAKNIFGTAVGGAQHNLARVDRGRVSIGTAVGGECSRNFLGCHVWRSR